MWHPLFLSLLFKTYTINGCTTSKRLLSVGFTKFNPNHRALDAEKNVGVHLTESFAMQPASAVSGFYFSHPQSQYFGVGKIEKDQVAGLATRKGMDMATMERWLAPVLNYDR